MSSKTKTTAVKEVTTPTLVPKLRFPEFRKSEGWKQKTGNRLFDQINDRKPEPGLPVLAITQEHGAIPRHMIDYHVSVTEKSIESYKVVQVGDFIISLRSFQGGIEYSQYHGICSPAYVILRKRGEGSDVYFKHYLKTDRFIQILTKNLEGLRDGKMVSYAQFSELLVPVPSPAEQQKIASCLSSVDELIAAQARKLDALKTHKKGLMQQLFPREGETQPRLRFPEFQNAGEWEMSELGSLSDVRDGTHDSPSFFPTGWPLVTSKNLRPDGTLDLENVSLISEEDYEQINKRSKVTVGDILFGMIGTIGNPVRIKSEGFAIKNVALIKEVGPLLNAFVVQLLQSGYVAAIFAVLNTGNSQKFIALGKIRGLPVPVPSLAEQQRIADCLTSLDALIAAQTQKLEALKTHKKGLMQQLFPSPEELNTI
jgi:type I restriction enzyme S subunit